MQTILLIRHGETLWNTERLYRGRADIELNETGIRQAGLLAEYLKDLPLEAVYSSPLKRAMKTARAVAAPHNLNVVASPELMDLDYGQWQGLSHSEVKQRYAKLYDEWGNNPQQIKIPGGERLDDVRKRVRRLVKNITSATESTVALVSHNAVNKVFICALLGLDNSHFWNIQVDTCSITTFNHKKGSFILIGHNDTHFLEPVR